MIQMSNESASRSNESDSINESKPEYTTDAPKGVLLSI